MLQHLQEENSLVSNLVSIGPILLMETSVQINFDNMIHMTIPLPHRHHTGEGHLHVVTINSNMTCTPCSSNSAEFVIKNGYLTLKTWMLTG